MSSRVRLRELEPGDAAEIAAWGSDASFCRHASWREDLPEAELQAFWTGVINDPPENLRRLAAVLAGQVVGYVDLHGDDPQVLELGYMIGPVRPAGAAPDQEHLGDIRVRPGGTLVSDRRMALTLSTPRPDQATAAINALRHWQDDAAPLQLHPGDIGWFRRFGTEATAAAIRTWSSDGQVLAVGLLDGADLLRVTAAPQVQADQAVAEAIAADIDDPARGVLPAGAATVEAPSGSLLQAALGRRGWAVDEAWTPLRRDLSAPVEPPGLRIETVADDRSADWAAVVSSAFGNPAFGPERWSAIAEAAIYADARSLVGYDEQDAPVAAITVWSAGPGRPGLIEPMGVAAGHRGNGYGRGITLAGAAALRALGSSSAQVGTPSSLTGAVATYRSAGFAADAERTDRRRSG